MATPGRATDRPQQQDNESKATRYLLFKMIAKQERTPNNAQHNNDKHGTPTTNGKHTKQQINNNNRTTALECTAA